MLTHRPFRFGVGDFTAASREAWVAKARKAEALGYATFLIPDHFQKQFAPLIALMVAADATRTLRVGSFVCNNDFRHPAVLAKEVATLDFLSDWRFATGSGPGGHRASMSDSDCPSRGPECGSGAWARPCGPSRRCSPMGRRRLPATTTRSPGPLATRRP